MMWIDKVSPETSFRAMRVLARASTMPEVIASWRANPHLLGLFVEGDRRPSVVIGGPEAIEKQIRTRLPPPAVSAIVSALAELWADPRREEAMLALVVWRDKGAGAEPIAVDVTDAFRGPVDPLVKPGPLAEGASPEERKRWLRKYGAIATERVGSANMRACAARDEVALIGVEADGTLSYGYAPRTTYREDFPAPVKLGPGEIAACHTIIADMGLPGEEAPYEPFRMVARAANRNPAVH